MNEHLKIIGMLIGSGKNLEDSAETCGHNEELSSWRKNVGIAKKFLKKNGIDTKQIDKIIDDENEKSYQREKKRAEKRFLEEQEKKNKKGLDFLESIGM